jgi:FixJ family two-component response regulator
MTAYPSMGSAVEALRIGAQDYVEKPSPELDTIADRVQSAIRAVRLRDERDGLLVKLAALQQELKDKDGRVRDLEIQLAMAEQVGKGADLSSEDGLRAARTRDQRLIQSAEKLVAMARFLRANEKLLRAIEAHVTALRLG